MFLVLVFQIYYVQAVNLLTAQMALPCLGQNVFPALVAHSRMATGVVNCIWLVFKTNKALIRTRIIFLFEIKGLTILLLLWNHFRVAILIYFVFRLLNIFRFELHSTRTAFLLKISSPFSALHIRLLLLLYRGRRI